MKLQKLTIKNLASIEDAVIDFENGPLSEESLFLICGETGAGKQHYSMPFAWHSTMKRRAWNGQKTKSTGT